jgi:hypothetical protein
VERDQREEWLLDHPGELYRAFAARECVGERPGVDDVAERRHTGEQDAHPEILVARRKPNRRIRGRALRVPTYPVWVHRDRPTR